MNLKLPPEIESYRKRYRDFVRDHVLPYDTTPESFDEHENIRPELLSLLRAKAKEEGLWAPQMPRELGGQGLPVAGMAACYEELNYSLFGPVSANCAAPDDGNKILLNKVGTPAQKERWDSARTRFKGWSGGCGASAPLALNPGSVFPPCPLPSGT